MLFLTLDVNNSLDINTLHRQPICVKVWQNSLLFHDMKMAWNEVFTAIEAKFLSKVVWFSQALWCTVHVMKTHSIKCRYPSPWFKNEFCNVYGPVHWFLWLKTFESTPKWGTIVRWAIGLGTEPIEKIHATVAHLSKISDRKPWETCSSVQRFDRSLFYCLADLKLSMRGQSIFLLTFIREVLDFQIQNPCRVACIM